MPLGHCGGGLIPVAALFHLEGVQELSAWRYAPQLRIAAAFGPDDDTAEALRAWLHSPSATFSPATEGSRVSIFAPGCTLTVVVSLTPPTLRQLADQVSDWLLTHYGPGTLFDCGLAVGDVCLFVYMPEQVSNLFAGAIQIVRAHPFFRLVSRGALHRTPADRLRFLTFETDAANTMAIPQGASSSGSSRGGEVERAVLSREEGEDVDEGHSLIQLHAVVEPVPGISPSERDRGGGVPSEDAVLAEHQVRAIPSPARGGVKPGSCSVSVRHHKEDESYPPASCVVPCRAATSPQALEMTPFNRAAVVTGQATSMPAVPVEDRGAWHHRKGRVDVPPGDETRVFDNVGCSTCFTGCGVRFPIDLEVGLRLHSESAARDLADCYRAALVISRLTQGLPPCILMPDIAGLPVPSWLRDFVASVPVCGPDRLLCPGAVANIYTDGSERLDKVGYALVVTVFTPAHGLAFLGAFALNARARNLGEEVFDLQEAESAGVVLALLWILAAPPHVQHFLWFDCTSAGLGASGAWRPPQHAGRARRFLSMLAELGV